MRNNLAESVRARLHNIAKAQQADLQQMMERFALERVLYRIGQSQYNKQFMLKGAMLFSLWYDMPHRMTRDIDLLDVGDSDLASMKKIFQEMISIACNDGIIFYANKIVVERILEETSYVGVKVTIPAELAAADDIIKIN